MAFVIDNTLRDVWKKEYLCTFEPVYMKSLSCKSDLDFAFEFVPPNDFWKDLKEKIDE